MIPKGYKFVFWVKNIEKDRMGKTSYEFKGTLCPPIISIFAKFLERRRG